MALAVTSAGSELLTDVEAKTHLRVLSGDFDTQITALVRASRDYCEKFTQRTLRTSTTRAWKREDWWCEALDLPWPPLIAVSSITYFDTDNVSQTLSSGEYHVEIPTDGGGRIVWADDAEIPDLYARPDAVTITFTTGYASQDVLPPVALQAMKTKLTELWAAGSEGEVRAAKECTDRLLGMVDWTGYA